jgi:hypothetical protein
MGGQEWFIFYIFPYSSLPADRQAPTLCGGEVAEYAESFYNYSWQG